MLVVPLLAEEVEYELNEDNRYKRMKFHITDKQMKHIKHNVVRKIAMREVARNRKFAKQTRRIHLKIRKARTNIEGIKKRINMYNKIKKQLLERVRKIKVDKQSAAIQIKALKYGTKKRIARREIKSYKYGTKFSKSGKRRLLKVQNGKIRKIIRKVNGKERIVVRRLKHIQGKINRLMRKMARYQVLIKSYRTKLAILLRKKGGYKNKLQQRRKLLLAKASRHFKIYAAIQQIDKHVEHIEQRLGLTTNYAKKVKLMKARNYLLKKQKRLRKRADQLKRRKMERKQRKMKVMEIKRKLTDFYKKYRYDKHLKKAQFKKLLKQLRFLKRQYNRAKRGYLYARSLKKREAKALALKGARKAYLATREKIYMMRKNLRGMKYDSMQQAHAIIREMLKLKISHAKLRIIEHQGSVRKLQLYKRKVMKRIHQLNKMARRVELCPANRKIVNSKLKINRKRLVHANRRIAIAKQGIKRQQIRIGIIVRKLRQLTIKEYKLMKSAIASIKRSIRTQKRIINNALYQKACMGKNMKKRASFIIKKAKSEIRILKVEMNSLRMKVRAVDDAIAEEKRQRLTVTGINYHKTKAALHEIKIKEKKMTRFVKKNVMDLTSSTNRIKDKALTKQYSKLMKRLIKIKDIKQKLINKLNTLRNKLRQMKAQEERDFLDKKRKWEKKRNDIVRVLNSLAKKDVKFVRKLHRGCKVRKCFIMFHKKFNLLRAHKLQIKLFRVTKKLEKINEEYVRRAEKKSFNMMGKRFAKQKKEYKKISLKHRNARKKLENVKVKINKEEERLPYLKNQQKAVGKRNVAKLEKKKKEYVRQKAKLVKRKRIILRRYLDLNKQFTIQLKKRMIEDKKRIEELRKERPMVLHKTLYELIPRKQRRAERKLTFWIKN